MAKLDAILLKSKFRGCMLGTLLGDCLGAPFEGEAATRVVVHKYFDKLDGPYVKQPRKQYTDDTAMTKSVAKALADKPTVDFKLLAKLFVKEYFSEPRRGYGENVVEVFHKLRGNKFEDVYKPAREQFSGTGSYGNGAAMRVAPVALFFHDDYHKMIETATKASEITHTHKLGVSGALLQCIAIEQSLRLHPNERADYHVFTKNLIDKMKEVEAKDDMSDLNDPTPYQTQLKVVQKLLSVQPPEEPISEEGVAAILGNSVSALHSVPTAIYCYLRAQNSIPDINSDNIFRRTIEYAVSLGGDTDTIAAMAGSIAGAHLGEEYVSENLLRHCEYVDEMLELADNLLTQRVASQVQPRAMDC